MPDSERDLATLIEDVKTIKSILQNTDAPLPPVWRLLYFVAFPALILIGLLKFFVPAFAALSYLDTVLWLWTPVFTIIGVIIAVRVRHYLKKTGTRFMAQSRVQTFLYTRFVLAPAVLTLGYLLSLNPSVSLEGCMAVLVAIGMTQLIVLMPNAFRMMPFVFLIGGWAELLFHVTGPLWTLANTLAVSAALFWIAGLLQRGETTGEVSRG